jgi:hypothetical protein
LTQGCLEDDRMATLKMQAKVSVTAFGKESQKLFVGFHTLQMGEMDRVVYFSVVVKEKKFQLGRHKVKYMIMSRHPNSGQNQNIRIADESFESVVPFKYLGTTLTNQNDIHDEIRSRLNSGNACYYSIQTLCYLSHIK